MKKKLLVTMLLSTVLITSCSSGASNSALDAAAFQAKITESAVVVLDVRTTGEFHSGHIIAAQNIDVESSDFANQISTLDKTATYAIYCHSGRRSAMAVDLMKKAGFSSLYELSGGIQTWQSAGLPLVVG